MATVHTVVYIDESRGSGPAVVKAKCPVDDHELKGCGSENVSDPDSEGFRDCFHCGLFYKDSSVTPDGEVKPCTT